MRALALALLLFLTAVPHAQAQQEALTSFTLRPANPAVNSRDLFEWPVTTDIDAVLSIDVPTASVAQVLLVIFESGEVVSKYKGKYQLSAGPQQLRLPAVFSTAKVLGQRLLAAQLELAVKGYGTSKRELTFEVQGPPQPMVQIESLRLYAQDQSGAPNSTSSVRQFNLGQPFMVELIFGVSENPAQLQPRVIVLASMVEDDSYSGYDLPEQMYEEHYDTKTIPDLEDGVGRRRVVLRGTMPRAFAEPWNNFHPFRIYAAIDFGSGPRVVEEVEGEVFDYQPGEDKRNDDPRLRLVNLSRSNSWTVSEPDDPQEQHPARAR
jgi:hypothetical protein